MTYFALPADKKQLISNIIITPINNLKNQTEETIKGIYKFIIASCLTSVSPLDILKKDELRDSSYYYSAYQHAKNGGTTGILGVATAAYAAKSLAQSAWTPIKKFGTTKTLGITLITCLIYHITSTAYEILNNEKHPLNPLAKLVIKIALKTFKDLATPIPKLVYQEITDQASYLRYQFHAKTEFECSLGAPIWKVLKQTDFKEKIHFSIRYKIKNAEAETVERKRIQTVHFKYLPRNFFSIFSKITRKMNEVTLKHNENEKAHLTSIFTTYIKQENNKKVQKINFEQLLRKHHEIIAAKS